MHPTHRFFFFSFFLAVFFIFANFFYFFLPADRSIAQINPAYYGKYFSSFLSLAYNDYSGISYYCPTGFTNKGYFKPDGVSQTAYDTAYDVSGRALRSG